jgi:hypothetical protein
MDGFQSQLFDGDRRLIDITHRVALLKDVRVRGSNLQLAKEQLLHLRTHGWLCRYGCLIAVESLKAAGGARGFHIYL